MENDGIRNSTDEVLEINKTKRDFKIELALFCILGILLGITLKTEAAKRITIGFSDYKIEAARDSYNVSDIKKKLAEEAAEAQQQQLEQGEVPAPATDGAACH
ncbi:MAG TPA: hypothetical protein DD454_03745 [Candidatus Moranbacteria bacterium]|nr:hypothetical protein [Candidatus Moranbacteria bacterium]